MHNAEICYSMVNIGVFMGVFGVGFLSIMCVIFNLFFVIESS